MSDALTITHSGVVITYDEPTNRFKFELRGRQRSAESLAKAREAIDKPISEKEEKTFKPVECWLFYRNDWVKGRVTSVAESAAWRVNSKEVWFVNGLNRSKQRVTDCYPVGQENDTLVERWNQLDAEIERVRAEQYKVLETMKTLKID